MSLVDPARPDAPMSSAAPAASRTTVVVSLAAHVVVVTLVVVVPLFGQADLPAPSQGIGAFVKYLDRAKTPLIPDPISVLSLIHI